MKATALDHAPSYEGGTGEEMARSLAAELGLSDVEALACIATAGAHERPKVVRFDQLTTARHAVTYYACRLMLGRRCAWENGRWHRFGQMALDLGGRT